MNIFSTIRNIVLASAAAIASVACSFSNNKQYIDNDGTPRDYEDSLVPDTTFHNLDQIPYGEVVCAGNKIKNLGTQAVCITEVSTDCGCLKASFETTPILPGDSARIQFEFDTHGNVGKQYHLATIKADNDQTIKICFYADIAEPSRY